MLPREVMETSIKTDWKKKLKDFLLIICSWVMDAWVSSMLYQCQECREPRQMTFKLALDN